jgi:hypothetical protein
MTAWMYPLKQMFFRGRVLRLVITQVYGFNHKDVLHLALRVCQQGMSVVWWVWWLDSLLSGGNIA